MLLIIQSPLLLHLCGHLVCSYMLSSLLFFGRALVLASKVPDSGGRMRWFAGLHSSSASAILLLQLFATGALMAAESVCNAVARVCRLLLECNDCL